VHNSCQSEMASGKGKDPQGGGPSAIYEPGHDLRLDFIFEYITRSLKIKSDKWMKMLVTEEYKAILNAFFTIENKRVSKRNKIMICTTLVAMN